MDEPLEIEPGKTVRGRVEPAKADVPARQYSDEFNREWAEVEKQLQFESEEKFRHVRINTVGRDFLISQGSIPELLALLDSPAVTVEGLRRAMAAYATEHHVTVNQANLIRGMVVWCIREGSKDG